MSFLQSPGTQGQTEFRPLFLAKLVYEPSRPEISENFFLIPLTREKALRFITITTGAPGHWKIWPVLTSLHKAERKGKNQTRNLLEKGMLGRAKLVTKELVGKKIIQINYNWGYNNYQNIPCM